MKKLLLSILTMHVISASAQLPGNDYVQYEFTQGSLSNTSVSGAAGLTGTFTSVEDRFAASGNAISPSSNMSGANLGATNINNTTLCFWVKRSALSSNVRIIQMYGTGGNGYRVEMDGTDIHINGQVESGTGSTGGTFASPQGNGSGLDDDTWHHIAVRTKGVNANTSIQLELFVDGTQVMLGGAVQQYWTPGGTVNNFLENATLVIDPLNGGYGGAIDDIYLYKDELTNAEIVQIYNYPMSAAPIVNILDANFKAYLVGNTFINTNGDTEIQVSEASAFTGTINAYGLSISDFTGLEAFTNIQYFYGGGNTALSIDLSNSPNLIQVFVDDGLLTSLLLPTSSTLTELRANENALSLIDVTSLSNLDILYIYDNNISTIDLSLNSNLTVFWADNNNLSSIDLTGTPLVTILRCRENNLTNVDLSDLSDMNFLSIDNNNLTSLNVANGNNSNFTSYSFQANPSLTCIEVDDAAWSTANWTSNLDSQTSYSENCASVGVNEVNSIEVTTFPNPTSGIVSFSTTEIITSIEIYNLTGQKVSKFSNTQTIDVSNLPSGIYTATIQTKNGKTALKKLVKE